MSKLDINLFRQNKMITRKNRICCKQCDINHYYVDVVMMLMCLMIMLFFLSIIKVLSLLSSMFSLWSGIVVMFVIVTNISVNIVVKININTMFNITVMLLEQTQICSALLSKSREFTATSLAHWFRWVTMQWVSLPPQRDCTACDGSNQDLKHLNLGYWHLLIIKIGKGIGGTRLKNSLGIGILRFVHWWSFLRGRTCHG